MTSRLADETRCLGRTGPESDVLDLDPVNIGLVSHSDSELVLVLTVGIGESQIATDLNPLVHGQPARVVVAFAFVRAILEANKEDGARVPRRVVLIPPLDIRCDPELQVSVVVDRWAPPVLNKLRVWVGCPVVDADETVGAIPPPPMLVLFKY